VYGIQGRGHRFYRGVRSYGDSSGEHHLSPFLKQRTGGFAPEIFFKYDVQIYNYGAFDS